MRFVIILIKLLCMYVCMYEKRSFHFYWNGSTLMTVLMRKLMYVLTSFFIFFLRVNKYLHHIETYNKTKTSDLGTQINHAISLLTVQCHVVADERDMHRASLERNTASKVVSLFTAFSLTFALVNCYIRLTEFWTDFYDTENCCLLWRRSCWP